MQRTTRKTSALIMRYPRPRSSPSNVQPSKLIHLLSDGQVLEDEATRRATSKKAELLKPQRKDDSTCAVEDHDGRIGLTLAELGTMRRLNKDTFKCEKSNDKKRLTSGGRWTKEEINCLKDMLKDHSHPRVIAHRLGRKTPSVVGKIRSLSEYFRQDNEANVFKGPQSLSPELKESILTNRFQAIWDGLMKGHVTLEWAKSLAAHPVSHWQAMITQACCPELMPILTSIQPPRLAIVEALPWHETSVAGVFAWILKPRKTSFQSDDQCYVYIGSASQHGVGLSGRKAKLLTQSNRGYGRLVNSIKSYKLNRRRGQFVTLLKVPFANDSVEEIMRVRTLVELGKFILAVWLGATCDDFSCAISHFTPWDVDTISYRGLTTQTDLSRNVKAPKSRKGEADS